MLDTGWKLTLKNAASTPARKITRDILALNSALGGLASASSSAQAALDKVGGGTTAGRLRAQTSLVRAQTKALREQRATSAQSARVDRSAAAQRARETKQQVDAHKAVARAQAQSAAASRRVQSQAAGGRTRLDVAAMTGRTRMDIGGAPTGRTRMDLGAAASGGRTRMDVAAPSGAGGRTRVDVAALAGRTRAEGPTAGEFQARARALQASHNAKMTREADRGARAAARVTEWAHKREESENAQHYRNIYNAAKKNAAALERLNAQAAARNARARAAAGANRAQTQGITRGVAMGQLGLIGGIVGGVATAALGAGTALAGIGLSAARAGIGVLSFREQTLAALTAVTGSATDAGRTFQNAITIANQTPLDTTETVAAMTALRVAQFSERDTAPMLAAFADISAARGNEAGQAYLRVVSQIRGLGRVNRGDIQQQALTAGLSPQDIYDSIARQMNLGTGAAGRQAAEARVGSRGVNSAVGLQAFLDATRRAYDNNGQGQLGSFARSQSQTLTGALSNLDNAPTNLLLQLNTMQSPGIIAFKNAILALTSAFDSNAPAGQALLRVIETVTNSFGGLFAAVNPTNIAGGLGMVGRAFGAIGRFAGVAIPMVRAFVQGMGPGFMAMIAPLRLVFSSLMSGGGPSATTLLLLTNAARGLGFVLGAVAGAFVTIVAGGTAFFGFISSVVTTGIGLIGNVAAQFTIAFQGVGTGIVNGIIAGVRAGTGALVTSVTGLGSTAVAAIRTALGIHSPSRVFADLVGAQIPAGIAQGVNAHAGLANDAVSGIVSPRVPQLGGGGASVTIEINVTGGAQPQETARAIRTEIEDALGGIFGQWSEALA